ncbi:NACHT domain protein [Aspergillus sclerotialis]|uniref:NACHT domain protein n=1 Tax=Aspergillus sclerotialis TaxID=2070753 RepID=A0A3A2Z4G6_9EURO|nr:NACHT domain protein [Aspergillus sclerotialis]
MDGLSSAASVIAVIQLTGSIVKICGSYLQEVKDARDQIITLQRTVASLESILHKLSDLLQETCDAKLDTSPSLVNDVSDCLSHLESLKKKIYPVRGKRMMRRLGIQALKWPLKRTEVDKTVHDLERYKSSFILSLQVGQASLLSGLAQGADRLDRNLGLDKLPFARGAEFNSYIDQHEDECLPGTRTEVLGQIADWVVSPQGKCIFWLNGMAGTGKSTISRTTAKSFKEAKLLGASFFFKRGEGDRGNAMKLFSTITRQLVLSLPQLIPGVQKALDDDPDVVDKSLKEQFEKLLLQPLLSLESSYLRTPTLVIVIDALDECERDEDIRVILQLLPQLGVLNAIRLRIFLTSRPEWPILREVSKASSDERDIFVLHEIDKSAIEHDISLFLRNRLSVIRVDRSLPAGWPGDNTIQSLVKLSSPLFIFAATACRMLEDPQWDPVDSLAEIFAHRNDTSQFDGTYLPVLNRLLKGQSKNQERKLIQDFREIIGAIVMLESPLSVVSLSQLLGLTEGKINRRLNSLRSVLNIPVDVAKPVRLFHLSFRDFLLDQETRSRTIFWVDEKETHQMLFFRCLYVCDTLRKNICGIKYGTRRAEIDRQVINYYIPPELQYACRYWAHHLTESKVNIATMNEALSFLDKHFLHWIEAMSLLDLVSEVVGIINQLQSALQNENKNLSEFLHDAKMFFLKNQRIADEAPLQIYCAGLWINMTSDTQERWSAELQTLEGHSHPVASVAFSYDGSLLASGSDDQTVQLWDPTTGSLKLSLEGHVGPVNSVTFSNDGRLLASGSDDRTVRLWDPATGALQYNLNSHLDRVSSVAFSHDGRLLASGSDDRTIKLWDPATGALQHTLNSHLDRVSSVAFSHDNHLLASSSDDQTIRLWNTATGVVQQILVGHLDRVRSVAFSHDSCLLASGSDDHTVRLWDPATGALKRTLEGHSCAVASVAFSCDSLLASGSYDRTVRLWDPSTGALRQTFEGHSRAIRSAEFSHDGRLIASGSYDKTVRLWDLAAGSLQQSSKGRSGLVFSVAFSGDGRLLASGTDKGTIQLLDPTTAALQQTLQGHSDTIRSVTFSNDDRLLASGSDDQTVRLWDIASGAPLQTLEGHSNWIRSVAFSYDGHLLASGSDDQTVRIWDLLTGTLKYTLKGHLDLVFSVAFSRDGRFLASGSFDRTIRLWDSATGALQKTLEGHSDAVRSVAFSYDSRILASGSFDLTVRLWNPLTGALQQILDSKRIVTDLKFSEDGSYLETDLGYLRIQASPDTSSPNEPEANMFFVEGQWVTFRGENVLWLPPGYWPDSSTVKGNRLAWGHAPGRVSIIEFCAIDLEEVED